VAILVAGEWRERRNTRTHLYPRSHIPRSGDQPLLEDFPVDLPFYLSRHPRLKIRYSSKLGWGIGSASQPNLFSIFENDVEVGEMSFDLASHSRNVDGDLLSIVFHGAFETDL
jgi:hypothetical protein